MSKLAAGGMKGLMRGMKGMMGGAAAAMPVRGFRTQGGSRPALGVSNPASWL